MSHQSAVQFETDSRVHMGLAVKDLSRSVAFYTALFGQGPGKTRPHYARFEPGRPPVNLALNEIGGEKGPNNPVAHFGIQVKSTEAVRQIADRLAEAGLQTRKEEGVTCCYAVQNKVWTVDPDGNKWEVYVVVDDRGAYHHTSQGDCCTQAVQQDARATTPAPARAASAACCSMTAND
jgi:catechol 2,3-dioxygenase-like lactoylglutathione lyase family enzyme